MCGIAGIFSLGNASFAPQDLTHKTRSMMSFIAHRGPDEAGTFSDRHASLGNVRLNIIDLVSGQQPMSAQKGRYWIAYNGEVYNYRELRQELQRLGHTFQTSSDTEVVLHAYIEWKEEALNRLNGGYAFVIYDRLEKEIFLARDRFGKRPLMWVEHQNRLYFASEMKAFLALDDFAFNFDVEQIHAIGTVWTPVDNQTGFENIRQLPAGSWMKWRKSSTPQIERYWTFPTFVEPPKNACSFDQSVEDLRVLLNNAVELRLRSDVEVGTYLSGGLDSTIITALASAQVDQRIRAFSVAFEDSSFDESSYQDKAARHLGVELEVLRVDHNDILGEIPRGIWHAEFPQFRSAFSPLSLLSKRVQDAGIKVVLTGEGADEIFLGYDIFKETLLRQAWPDLSSEQRTERLMLLYPYLDLFSKDNVSALVRVFENSIDDSNSALFSHRMRFDNGRFVSRFLNQSGGPGTEVLQRFTEQQSLENITDPVRRAQWLEVHTLMEGYLLSSQGDRASMANGVESRCPFLDHRIAEWAAKQPLDYSLQNGLKEKHILKAAFGDLIEDSVVERPKQPYRAPGASALSKAYATNGQLPVDMDAFLNEDALAATGLLDTHRSQKFIEKMVTRDPDRISAREDQALMFILSLSILNQDFVLGQGKRRSRDLGINTVCVEIDNDFEGCSQ